MEYTLLHSHLSISGLNKYFESKLIGRKPCGKDAGQTGHAKSGDISGRKRLRFMLFPDILAGKGLLPPDIISDTYERNRRASARE